MSVTSPVNFHFSHAQYSLGDYKAAADAFSRGLKYDADNAGLKSGLQNAQSRIVDDDDDDDGPPPLVPDDGSVPPPAASANPLAGMGGMADMLRGMGGGAGGGGGGMPDLASIMNNPQMMNMAQQMAANGGLENLMRNPAVANMMNRVQSGNMPSMAELMSDPTMQQL